MADPFLGEIRMFAGNYAPARYALCQGQILQIQQNQSLYSLIGTTFGGDGSNTMALPNLTCRVPVGIGTTNSWGQMYGAEGVRLSIEQMPAHTHGVNQQYNGSIQATTDVANAHVPTSNTRFGKAVFSGQALENYIASQTEGVTLAGIEVSSTVDLANQGSNYPHNNMQPYLPINYIISLAGVYPPRP